MRRYLHVRENGNISRSRLSFPDLISVNTLNTGVPPRSSVSLNVVLQDERSRFGSICTSFCRLATNENIAESAASDYLMSWVTDSLYRLGMNDNKESFSPISGSISPIDCSKDASPMLRSFIDLPCATSLEITQCEKTILLINREEGPCITLSESIEDDEVLSTENVSESGIDLLNNDADSKRNASFRKRVGDQYNPYSSMSKKVKSSFLEKMDNVEGTSSDLSDAGSKERLVSDDMILTSMDDISLSVTSVQLAKGSFKR